jgi:hypothetical protein
MHATQLHTQQYTQVTTNGELTLATISQAQTITLSVEYASQTQQYLIDLQYTGIETPTVRSPWIGSRQIILNNTRLTPRSFNFMTTHPAPVLFQTGAIVSGTPVRITERVDPGNMVILLTNKPYSSTDRNKTQFIDVSSLIQPKMFFQDGELFVHSDVIQDTYPHIVVI